jgi:hypothetical protein
LRPGERKAFFFEKRTKKLLLILGYGLWDGRGRIAWPVIWKDGQLQKPLAQSQKSFLVLFFKKEPLPCCRP